jgi:hypothetical protein
MTKPSSSQNTFLYCFLKLEINEFIGAIHGQDEQKAAKKGESGHFKRPGETLPNHDAVTVFVKIFNEQKEQQQNQIKKQMHAAIFLEMESYLAEISQRATKRGGTKKDPGE